MHTLKEVSAHLCGKVQTKRGEATVIGADADHIALLAGDEKSGSVTLMYDFVINDGHPDSLWSKAERICTDDDEWADIQIVQANGSVALDVIEPTQTIIETDNDDNIKMSKPKQSDDL